MPGPSIHPSRARNFRKGKVVKKTTKITVAKAKTRRPKKVGKNVKRRGRKNTRRGGTALSKMLQPFIDADQAARMWIAHINDPWNNPPVPLGRTSNPTGIARAFATSLTVAAGSFDSVLLGFKPCCYSTNNNFTDSQFSLGGSTWSGASGAVGLFNLPWANYTFMASISNAYRPISCAARMSFRYPSTTIPPYLYGGVVPLGALTDTPYIGNNAVSATTPPIVYQTPTTSKVNGNSIQVNWCPEDFSDISGFLTSWGIAASSAPITTLPYIGAIGLVSTGWSVEVEYISFFQYEQNYQDTNFTTTQNDAVNYSCSELWDRYVVHKDKLELVKKPMWTSMHAARSAHIGRSGGERISFAERPGNTENKDADHEVEFKGSNLDDEAPITRNHMTKTNGGHDVSVVDNIKIAASNAYSTIEALAAEWGPTVYGIYKTFDRYHRGNRGIMMLRTDLQDGMHDHLINPEKKEQKIQPVFDKKTWLDNLPPVKIPPREVKYKFNDPSVLGEDGKLVVPTRYIARLVEQDLALPNGKLRLKCAIDYDNYMHTIKEIDEECDSEFDSVSQTDISESVSDLLDQQNNITQQLSAKMQRNAEIVTK